MRVKCFAQEHNTMSPGRARTRITHSGVKRTNHEATVPPHHQTCNYGVKERGIFFGGPARILDWGKRRSRRSLSVGIRVGDIPQGVLPYMGFLENVRP